MLPWQIVLIDEIDPVCALSVASVTHVQVEFDVCTISIVLLGMVQTMRNELESLVERSRGTGVQTSV